MPSCVPFGGGVPKERAPARYGPSASSTRPSGGCSVSYSYWPRSSSSIPAARCSGSSQVLEYTRSEEHTSELQSQSNLVCRLLLEKKKKKRNYSRRYTNHMLSYTRRRRVHTFALR